MTRINCGVAPRLLHNKHLLAEHREIVRIPNTIKSGKAQLVNIPTNFRLGAGHVKFFYNKLLYLKNRYIALHKECLRRGFNISDFSEAFEDLPSNLLHDYKPTAKDKAIIEERILERLKNMKV